MIISMVTHLQLERTSVPLPFIDGLLHFSIILIYAILYNYIYNHNIYIFNFIQVLNMFTDLEPELPSHGLNSIDLSEVQNLDTTLSEVRRLLTCEICPTGIGRRQEPLEVKEYLYE